MQYEQFSFFVGLNGWFDVICHEDAGPPFVPIRRLVPKMVIENPLFLLP